MRRWFGGEKSFLSIRANTNPSKFPMPNAMSDDSHKYLRKKPQCETNPGTELTKIVRAATIGIAQERKIAALRRAFSPRNEILRLQINALVSNPSQPATPSRMSGKKAIKTATIFFPVRVEPVGRISGVIRHSFKEKAG